MQFMPYQKLGWIESGEGRIRQRVRRLAGVLVSQPQRQRERGRYLPVVLEKIGLAELVRMERRGAENPAGRGREPTEVVQEVRKSGIALGRQERDLPQRGGCRRL